MKGKSTLLVCFLSIALSSCSDSDPNKLQGYVEGRYTYAASYASGYLSKLLVVRGESVKAGQRLFELDQQPEAEDLAQAKAKLLSAEETYIDMQLGKRKPEIESIQAQIDAAKAEYVYAKQTYDRNKILYKKSAIGKSDLDKARSNFLSQKAMVAQLQANLLDAKLGARIHQQEAQAANVKAADAAKGEAAWILSRKTFDAPKSGRVDDTYYRQGEFIPAGQPVLSMLVPSDVKIVFFVPEPRLGKLQVGQVVHFTCDGCKASTASIDFIASKAEYTPPVLYTQGSRENLVYRVRAAIPAAIAMSYHPGQPVDITLPATGDAAKKAAS